MSSKFAYVYDVNVHSGGLMMMWKSFGTNGRMVNSSSLNVNRCQLVIWQMTELWSREQTLLDKLHKNSKL